MRSREPGRLILAAAAALFALLASAGAASATHRGAGEIDEVAIRVSYQPALVVGVSDQLIAQLTVDDGSGVAGVNVEFLREVDFLGPRLISLGKAATDAGGTARVPFQAGEPTLQVQVRFAGSDDYMPTQISTEISVPGAPGPLSPSNSGQEGHASLALFATVMPPVLAAISAAIWILLIGLSAVTVRAIWRGRSSVPRKEGQT